MRRGRRRSGRVTNWPKGRENTEREREIVCEGARRKRESKPNNDGNYWGCCKDWKIRAGITQNKKGKELLW